MATRRYLAGSGKINNNMFDARVIYRTDNGLIVVRKEIKSEKTMNRRGGRVCMSDFSAFCLGHPFGTGPYSANTYNNDYCHSAAPRRPETPFSLVRTLRITHTHTRIE